MARFLALVCAVVACPAVSEHEPSLSRNELVLDDDSALLQSSDGRGFEDKFWPEVGLAGGAHIHSGRQRLYSAARERVRIKGLSRADLELEYEGISKAAGTGGIGMDYGTNSGRGIPGLNAKVNHISLVVKDAQRSHAFYQNVLGAMQLRRPNYEARGFWFWMGNIQLHVTQDQSAKEEVSDESVFLHGGFVHHIALEVYDFEAVARALHSLDIPFVRISVPMPGAVMHQLFLQDPDGHNIEICNCQTFTDYVFGIDSEHEQIGEQLALTYVVDHAGLFGDSIKAAARQIVPEKTAENEDDATLLRHFSKKHRMLFEGQLYHNRSKTQSLDETRYVESPKRSWSDSGSQVAAIQKERQRIQALTRSELEHEYEAMSKAAHTGGVGFLYRAQSSSSGLHGLVAKVSHVSLMVKDAELSRFFYESVLGATLMHRPNFRAPGYWFWLGNIQLHFLEREHNVPVHPPPHGNIHVIALEVHDFEALQRVLAGMDFPFTLSTPSTSRGGVRQLLLQDPDGHRIEICDCHLFTDFAFGLESVHDSDELAQLYSESSDHDDQSDGSRAWKGYQGHAGYRHSGH